MSTIAAGTFSKQLSIDEQIDKIEQLFKIKILYKDSEQYIPLLWKIQSGNAESSQAATDNLQQLINILPNEIEKYPLEILQDNLSNIIVLGELKFFNISYGGTYLDKTIYITVGTDSTHKKSVMHLSSTFHHEFNSILMFRYEFSKLSWLAANPDGFTYAKTEEEKLQALKESTNIEGSKKLYKYGFLTEYNKSSLENDFNMYAEFAFTRPARLTNLAKKYPRIRRKVILLKEFYLNISKDFKPVMVLCCNI
ncbi:MAG TPA: hypothetical protein ENI64_07595 [Gammaproteobacteria bacterium]|nr:hypothetical protein [Gammaproteobacteria bacterium]